MSAEELRELYLNGDFTVEYITKENLYKLLSYEMANSGQGLFEKIEDDKLQEATEEMDRSSEIINFCVEQLQYISDGEFRRTIPKEDKEELEREFEQLMKEVRLIETIKAMRKSMKRVPKFVMIMIITFSMFFTTSFIGYAFEIDFFKFLFSSEKKSVQVNVEDNNDEKLYHDNYFEWLPDGYDVGTIKRDYQDYGTKTIYEYIHNTKEIITLQVRKVEDKAFTLYQEVNEGDAMTKYRLKGKTYYESKNLNLNQIMWSSGDTHYLLYSEVNVNILKEIIKNNEE